jgi:hypothetical protein
MKMGYRSVRPNRANITYAYLTITFAVSSPAESCVARGYQAVTPVPERRPICVFPTQGFQ